MYEHRMKSRDDIINKLMKQEIQDDYEKKIHDLNAELK